MHLVAIAWIYVVLMVALVEAFSAQGTVLGAIVTFVGYGVLPLAIVLYVMATPARRRLLRQRETNEQQASAPHGDGGDHAPGQASVATKREEP